MRVQHALSAVLVLAFVVVLACSSSKGRGTPLEPSSGSVTPITSTPAEASLEQQTHAKINDYRASKGMAILSWNDAIAVQARQHSKNMATEAIAFGHDGFSTRSGVIAQTIPWTRVAENVALTSTASDPATQVVNDWLNSAVHRANIEGNYNPTGTGVARSASGSVYVTQIFIKSR